MSDRDLSPKQGLQGMLSRLPAEMSEEEKKKTGVSPSIQRNPLEQITCRAGDPSCARAHASALDRSTAAEPGLATDSLLHLQRNYGNRYVQRVLGIGREGEENVAPSGVQEAIERNRGGGQQLDSGVRVQMGQAFNADFSGVRVHTDSQADGLNRALSARAFTTGQDIYFRQGEYRPGTSSGRQLLAHELTHVVQQNGDKVQGKLTVSRPGDIHEEEADRTAQAFPAWEQRSSQAPVGRESVHRQTAEEEKKKEEMKVTRQARDGSLLRQPEQEKEEEKPAQAKLLESGLQRQGEGEEEKEM
jgi:hypothetical protein